MNTQNTHTKFVVACITFLAAISALAGGFLLWKGFAGGAELVMTVNTAIAGLIGFLSNRPKDSAVQTPENQPSSAAKNSSAQTFADEKPQP